MRFRKRQMEVEAFQLSGKILNINELPLWFDGTKWSYALGEVFAIRIETSEGIMYASAGDWIVKGICGEFYPVKEDLFKKTYDFIGME